MGVADIKELESHRKHLIVCAVYAGGESVAVECETCKEVLIDFNRDDDAEAREEYLRLVAHAGHDLDCAMKHDRTAVECLDCDEELLVFHINEEDGEAVDEAATVAYQATLDSITREHLIIQCSIIGSFDLGLAELSRPGSFLVVEERKSGPVLKESGLLVVPATNKSWYMHRSAVGAVLRRPLLFDLAALLAGKAVYVLSEEGRAEYERRVRAGLINQKTLKSYYDYLCTSCCAVTRRTKEQIERRREALRVTCACGNEIELAPLPYWM